MALEGILCNSTEIKATGGWDIELVELFDSLPRWGVHVVDIGSTSLTLCERTKAAGLELKNCLLLAASKETASLAVGLPLAVIGYERGGRRIDCKTVIMVEGFAEVDYNFLNRMYQRFHQIPWTVLETKRCIVREISLADLDALYEIYGQKEITKYMEGLYESREAEEEYTKAYIENMYRYYGYGMWVVAEKSTGKIIGRAGLEHRELFGEIHLELGYVIALEYQRQGYAMEVTTAMLDFAARELEFSEISCLIQKENKASIQLAKKLCFTWVQEVECDGKKMQRFFKALHF